MSARQNPGTTEKITSFPHAQACRSIYVPSGDVVIVSGGVSTTFSEAQLPGINNLARLITEITSASGGVVFVTK